MQKGYLVESETCTIEFNTMIWNGQPYKKCKITTTYLLGLFYLKNFNCLQKHNQTYSDTEGKFEVYSLFSEIWSHGYGKIYYTIDNF